MSDDDHALNFLRAVLGKPAQRYFSSDSVHSALEHYVWRCGCSAKENGPLWRLRACDKHVRLNAEQFFVRFTHERARHLS